MRADYLRMDKCHILMTKRDRQEPVSFCGKYVFFLQPDPARHKRSCKHNDGKPDDFQCEQKACAPEFLVTDLWSHVFFQGLIPSNVSDRRVD